MLTSLGQKIEFASAEEKIKLKEEFDAIFMVRLTLKSFMLTHVYKYVKHAYATCTCT